MRATENIVGFTGQRKQAMWENFQTNALSLEFHV